MTKIQFKEAGASDCLLLNVSCTDDYFTACNWAYLEITPELKQMIIDAQLMAMQCREKFPSNFYSIKLWFYGVNWIDENELFESDVDGELPEGIIDTAEFDNDDYFHVEKLSHADFDSIRELRVETCQLLVDEGNFWFSGYVKNSNIQLTTTSVSMVEMGWIKGEEVAS